VQRVADDHLLVERLRAGDEEAFMDLVRRWSPTMLRVARMYVPSQAVAEDVVQETWLGVLNGLDRFEERSSLRTWVFSILVNRARSRGQRESRTVPFAALGRQEVDGEFAAVEPERFVREGDAVGEWAAPPVRWWEEPERALDSAEAVQRIESEIEKLPETQRAVITMRDVLGMSSEEVRSALDLSETNQRVLLHRARSKVRKALEDYYADE
jgi:RNA polymerase sigma-70 factor, ECF subfamily